MDTKIKKTWIKALRSGNYEQVMGHLGVYGDGMYAPDSGKDSFCCLGVLCDVLLDDDKAPVVLDDRVQAGYASDVITFNEGVSGVLPPAVANYIGTPIAPAYTIDFDPEERHLTRDDRGYELGWSAPFDSRGARLSFALDGLNDDGLTFDQIADILEWADPDDE